MKKNYPWILKYQIQTILAEDFLQVSIAIKRADKKEFNNRPLVNLSLYPYFAIGSDGFVNSSSGEAFIFAREFVLNFIDVVDCHIETAGARIKMSVEGAGGFCLHSSDFSQQGCIQPVSSAPREFGGEGDIELFVGETLQMAMTLEVM